MLTFIALCGFVLLAGIVIGYRLGHYFGLKDAKEIIESLEARIT